MRYVLARANTGVLAELARSRTLLAFDFDGTLAPIVDQRHDAQMRTRTVRLFAQVCKLYPCAVLSGRGRDDVASRFGGAAVRYVVGNHGLEPGPGLQAFEHQIACARELLEKSLAAWPGVEIEDKRYSLALHYRGSPQRRRARTAIYKAVSSLPVDARVVPGKLVVNVVPEQGSNKGDALLALKETERADTALYVGDDATDEDVFVLDQPGRLVTVRVGESSSTAARYFLQSQRAIDRLLARFVALREERVSP